MFDGPKHHEKDLEQLIGLQWSQENVWMYRVKWCVMRDLPVNRDATLLLILVDKLVTYCCEASRNIYQRNN